MGLAAPRISGSNLFPATILVSRVSPVLDKALRSHDFPLAHILGSRTNPGWLAAELSKALSSRYRSVHDGGVILPVSFLVYEPED